MPAMDVTSYRGDPIQESMMQLCPFWTCNIVRFGLATLYIYILQQTFVGGNPLPLGGGRSHVNLLPLTLALNVLLYGCR